MFFFEVVQSFMVDEMQLPSLKMSLHSHTSRKSSAWFCLTVVIVMAAESRNVDRCVFWCHVTGTEGESEETASRTGQTAQHQGRQTTGSEEAQEG